MPQGFDRCQKMKGRMRTVSGPNKRFGLEANQYMHICFDSKGNMHRGEIKHKESEKMMQ